MLYCGGNRGKEENKKRVEGTEEKKKMRKV
jgi:hypothetical protein